jgi:hypothetical protein
MTRTATLIHSSVAIAVTCGALAVPRALRKAGMAGRLAPLYF